MDLDKIPAWILDLEPEDAGFLKNFVLKSGSLKEIAKLYSVSYPHRPAAAGQTHPEDRAQRPEGGGALLRLHQGAGRGRPYRPGDRQADSGPVPAGGAPQTQQHHTVKARSEVNGMNPALTLVIAFLILAFHIWASRRSPRFWFLGGIVPWSGSAFWPFSGPAARSPCPRTGRY